MQALALEAPVDSWDELTDEVLESIAESRCVQKQDDAPTVNASRVWPPESSDVDVSEILLEFPSWCMAYTQHRGRVPDSASVDVLQLLNSSSASGPLRAAFLTTFLPFELKFLKHFPMDTELTICTDRGVELNDIELKDEDFETSKHVFHARSRFCQRCLRSKDDQRKEQEVAHANRPANMTWHDHFQRQRDEVTCCTCQAPQTRDVAWLFPARPGQFCMHPKIMILRFASYVRLIVSSFNMSEEQLNNAGDSFWWVDLPIMKDTQHHTKMSREAFLDPLADLLLKLGATVEWGDLLQHCDWSFATKGATQAHLVTSIPGEKRSKVGYGMHRLSSILSELPNFPAQTSPVDIQVWSLGEATDAWFTDLAHVVTQEPQKPIADWRYDHMRLIFQRKGHGPNHRAARAEMNKKISKIQRLLNMDDNEEFKPPSALKKILWDETASKLLRPMADQPRVEWGWHSKVMTRTYPRGFCKRSNCTRKHGWRYVGSHNCSRASWGSNYTPARNWEAGVVVISLPADSPCDECGVDLDEQVPMPFSTSALAPVHPEYRGRMSLL